MSKPVAFYRADWKGDMVFRKNNTVDVRKNESDFTKGWIKPLYAEVAEQPQLTIPKSVINAYENEEDHVYFDWLYATDKIALNDEKKFKERDEEIFRRKALLQAYLVGKDLEVDLVKVVEG